jgi:hypothetical protein
MIESILIQNKALALRLQGKVIQVSHVTKRFVRFRQIYDNEFVPRRWSKARLYWDKKGNPYFQVYGDGRVYVDELVPLEDVCTDSETE